MKKLFLTLSCLVLLAGCERPSGRWRAIEDVPVFKDADEANQLEFTVEKGGVCALGHERAVKVFMYKQISCDRGVGWVMYSNGYPFEKID